MNNEQAIKTLKGTLSLLHQTNVCFDDITDYREASRLAAEALEKQIPMKPISQISSIWGTKKEMKVCPVCDYFLTTMHFISNNEKEVYEKYSYCDTCGQKLDWGDE